jgi:hypothetical protein
MMPGTPTGEGDTLLRAVAAVLSRHAADGWLVGGSVRDLQLGRSSPDIDVVVTGDAARISRAAAGLLGAPWFVLSEEHRAYRVVGKRAHLDVAAVRGGAILADLAERDFTINAMALRLDGEGSTGDLVDPFQGRRDLEARSLRAVSDRIFADDPLRLMRAARFCHALGLDLEPSLREAIQAQAAEVNRAAPERVAAEMVLTLDAGRAGEAAGLWQGLGLLQAVAPELGGLSEAEGPGVRQADLERLEHLLRGVLTDPAAVFAGAGGPLARRLTEPVDGAVARPTALRLACLLRRLPSVEALGVGRRLRLSGPLTSLIETAARMCARPSLPAVAASSEAPGRAAVQFLWEAAPWGPEVILLRAVAAHPVEACGPGSAALDSARALMNAWALRQTAGIPRLPFDGNALMEELHLQPGPRLGKALRAARLAWEAGEARTAEQALAAARTALKEA